METKIQAGFAILISFVALVGTVAAGAGIAFDVKPITDALLSWQGIALMSVAAVATWLKSLPALLEQLKTGETKE